MLSLVPENYCYYLSFFSTKNVITYNYVSVILVFLQIREPFNVMALVKSPMGLMVGFMVVVMFLMPKLVENMGKYSTFDHRFLIQPEYFVYPPI